MTSPRNVDPAETAPNPAPTAPAPSPALESPAPLPAAASAPPADEPSPFPASPFPPPGYQTYAPRTGRSGRGQDTPAGPQMPARAAGGCARSGCLIASVGTFAVALLGMLAMAIFATPVATITAELSADLRGRATIETLDMDEAGGWHFVIRLEKGLEPLANDIACTIVKPDLRGTKFENAGFSIQSADGRVLATEATACG